jgi:transcription-repair coupling factor (superfamily II helicase)
MGGQYDLDAIASALVRCGYSRSEQVEGPGQFALRGGILDFFSPGGDEPFRVEFFGDEVDSVSTFDVSTQRRGQVCDEAVILPAAETLVSLYGGGEGGEEAFVKRLVSVRQGLEKRRSGSEYKKHIAADIERLENRRSFPAADKYIELLYPMATALDYIGASAVLFINEPGKVAERAKNYTWQLEEDSRTLLEAGVLESSLIRFALDWEELCARAADFPVVMADSFTVSSYPLKPREIVSLSAKQLPSYGGSLETAAGDIAHYVGSGYRTVILCQDERRAGILSEYLREKSISAVIDLRLERFPGSGECVVALGALSAGMEYPNAKLAVITEGQLVESVSLRKKRKKLPTNRERLQSFADLSPGDLVVHEHYGIGRYVGIFKMPVDGI